MLQRFAFLPLLIATASGAAALDRSTLSYEDNVTINTACHDALGKGAIFYQSCVRDQLASLPKHPAPKLGGLSSETVRDLEADCVGLRVEGAAPYNDCLTRALAREKPGQDAGGADLAAARNGPVTADLMLAKALGSEAPASAAPAVTQALPPPKSVLPKLPQADAHAAMAPADLYKLLERSIFVIAAAQSAGDARAGDIMQGSAVAVSPHLLLTNCHVVNDRPMIVLMQDDAVWKAKLVAADVANDRCVLESEGAALTPVPGVRLFDGIAVGEPVFAIGAPLALERTMTDGLVSGLRSVKGDNLIQTSAPVSPGSSGGGLFDARGNLLGITSIASTAGWQNLNFAIAAADYWE